MSGEHDIVVYRVIGKLTYINALDFQHRVKLLLPVKHLILSFKWSFFIDSGGVEVPCISRAQPLCADRPP